MSPARMRGSAAVLMALASLAAPAGPAHGAVLFNATCVATITMTFSPALKQAVSAGGFAFSGGGPCVGSGAVGLSAFSMSGSGSTVVASCEAIVASATGILSYTGAAPTAVSTVTAGNIASNATEIISGFPLVLGVGALAISPASAGAVTACATSPSGASSFTFVGSVTFSDPTL